MKKIAILLFSFLPCLLIGQTIQSISPNSGMQGQVLTVSITGQNTTFQQGTNLVKLFQSGSGTEIHPTSASFISNTLIEATFAFDFNHSAGLYDVVVERHLGTSTLTLPDGFTLKTNPNSPKLISINPKSAAQGQTLTVSITGQNTTFQQGSNAIKLVQNGMVIHPTSANLVSNTLIQATFAFTYNHPAGLYDVVVDNSSASSTLTLPNGFKLKAGSNPPKIASVNPKSATQGQTLTVSITGKNTAFQQGTNFVKLVKGGTMIYPTSTNFVSNTLIQATFAFNYGHPAGPYDVVVDNYSAPSTLTLPDGFTLKSGSNPPQIVSITPNAATQGQTLIVSITGQNTAFQQGSNAIRLIQSGTVIYPTSANFVSNTLIQATFAFTYNHPAGMYDVAVEHYSTSSIITVPNGFTLNAGSNPPQITSINPDSAMQGETLTISITGQNTAFQQSSNVVKLVQSGTIISSTSMNVVSNTLVNVTFEFTYNHPAGQYDVIVDNPSTSSSLSLPNGFTLNAGSNPPQITSINPNTATEGQTLTVSITGQNTTFQQGSNAIRLIQGGTVIYPTSASFVSDTLIQATFAFTFNYPVGVYDLAVNTYFLSNAFTLNEDPGSPKIIQVSPNCGFLQSQFTMTLYGENSHFLDEGITVRLTDGITSLYANSVTAINDTELSAHFSTPHTTLSGMVDVVIEGRENIILKNGFFIAGVLDIPNPSEEEKNIVLFPNPTSGALTLLLNSSTGEPNNVYIHNSLGEIVYSELNVSASETELPVDLQSQKNGVYLIRVVESNGKAKIARIIKQ